MADSSIQINTPVPPSAQTPPIAPPPAQPPNVKLAHAKAKRAPSNRPTPDPKDYPRLNFNDDN